MLNHDIVFTEQYPGRKMSECILDLCEDIMDGAENKKELTSIIGLACFAWNIEVITPEKKIDVEINRLVDDVLGNRGRDETIEFVRLIIKRKKLLYPNNKRFIMNYEFAGNKKKGFQLNIASTAPGQEVPNLK